MVSKRYTIYMPKAAVEELSIKEGEYVLLTVGEGEIILKPIRRVPVKPWTITTFEEIEEVGESLSKQILDSGGNPYYVKLQLR